MRQQGGSLSNAVEATREPALAALYKGKLQRRCGSRSANAPNTAPALEFTANFSTDYGSNTDPDRAFTAEMSEELIAPEAFTSNRKFALVVA